MAGSKEYSMLFQLNAAMGSTFAATFTSGQNSIQQMQAKIEQLNKTQGDISAYQKQQAAVEKIRSKLQLLQTQYENLKGVEAATATEEAILKNEMAAKEQQINKTTEKLDANTAKLTDMGQALKEAGVDTGNLAEESQRLAQEASEVAASQEAEAEAAQKAGDKLKAAMEGAAAAIETAGIVNGLKSVYNTLSDCAATAAEFETAMAGVKRTVGGDDAFIDSLGESFKRLSAEMPITAGELAGIATTAGQLGIAQENVESFTTVMAKLATTTDLTADDAATMLAQFANITGLTDYERLGSVVAQLGDATATTASKVVEMSQGMAATANLAGMSETDILAIAAAVGSLGIEAQAGSTAMSTLISTLYKATETGDGLEEFASVANMSADEFKQAWGQDAVSAMNAFIQGLNDTERNGRSAVVILDELGIKNVRQTKAILGLASAGDLLGSTIASATSAWEQNTALSEKASVMYGTTEAKMTMMQNAANNVKIAVGDALNPALGAVYDTMTGLIQPISEFIEANPAIVQGITAFIGVLGTVTAGIVGYTAVTKLAAAASALFAGSIPGVGVILGVAAAIGTLVGVTSALSGANAETTVSFDDLSAEYEQLCRSIEDNEAVLGLADSYRNANKEANRLSNLMGGSYSTEIKYKAKADNQLTPDDFIDDTTVKLTAEQANALAAADFLEGSIVKLTPDQASYLESKSFLSDTTVKLTPEQAKTLLSSQFLRSTKVQLTPEQKKLLKSDEFIDGTKTIKLTAEQATKLAAVGFMEGTTVVLTGEQAKTLAAEGFLTGKEVELTAKAARDLKASEFMADPTVEIIGEAGNSLSPSDFGLSETTLTFIASIDATSYADVTSKVNSLSSDVLNTKLSLNEASSTLSSMQTSYDALETRVNGTKNKQQKAALQSQMEELGEAIEAQQDKVDGLETEYNSLNRQYTVAATAASELKGKEDFLIATKKQLAEFTGHVSDASEGQTTSFEEEAQAAEDAANANLELLRSSMLSNVVQQSSAYIASLSEEKTALAEVEALTARIAGQREYLTSGATDDYNGVADSLDRNISALEKQNKAVSDADALQQQYISSMATMVQNGWMEMTDIIQLMDSAFADVEQSERYQIIGDVVKGVEEALADAAEAAEEYSDAQEEVAEGSESTARSIDDIIADITALGDAYEAAYKSARESMDGQFDLFEHVKQVSAGTAGAVHKNMADMQKALEEQQKYIEQYQANFQGAADKGVDQNLLQALSDGSKESAETLATLANASAEDIEALNAAYANLQGSKDSYATTVAEIETNFSSTMTTLEAELANTVSSMDFSSDAAANANASLTAFENQAILHLPKILMAYKRAADTAKLALKFKPTLPGYATGTKDAERGFAVVGENGPEVVFFEGGEQVLNAEDTKKLANQSAVNAEPVHAEPRQESSGNVIEVNFSPVYNVSGSNAADIEDVLEKQAGRLRDEVRSIMEDIASDKNRRNYA